MRRRGHLGRQPAHNVLLAQRAVELQKQRRAVVPGIRRARHAPLARRSGRPALTAPVALPPRRPAARPLGRPRRGRRRHQLRFNQPYRRVHGTRTQGRARHQIRVKPARCVLLGEREIVQARDEGRAACAGAQQPAHRDVQPVQAIVPHCHALRADGLVEMDQRSLSHQRVVMRQRAQRGEEVVRGERNVGNLARA
eukprot:scaffold17682_cov113-Isochrysis_galbana.AAC.13